MAQDLGDGLFLRSGTRFDLDALTLLMNIHWVEFCSLNLGRWLPLTSNMLSILGDSH